MSRRPRASVSGFLTAVIACGLALIAYTGNGTLNVAHCDDTACSSATTATVDLSVGVGEYPSIAIGADGLGLVSYYDSTNEHLKAVHLGIGVP